jgi:FkbM family methyltransferase
MSRLRPSKLRSALRRRWFERRVPRVPEYRATDVAELGTPYGGWKVPVGLLEPGWLCYSVGIGGDVSFDLALVRDYGIRVRAFDPVEQFVDEARAQAAGDAAFSAHIAAIATVDGPLRMQVSHDPVSSSVSGAQLYDSDRFVELPGRTLPSLMTEFGDVRIDFLKLDVEGAEYELLPTLDLRGLGVQVLATQLHHTGSVADARRLIAQLRSAGYAPVACRPAVKLTFAREELL